ncbi:tetratricopeptide repeat protein, partial [Pseudoduganella buxea]
AAPAAVTPVAPPAPAAPVPSAPPAVVAAVPVVPPASAAPVTAVPPSVEREPVVATPEPVNVAPRPVSQRERPAPRQAPAEPKSAPAERVPARVDTEALRTGVTQAWASAPPASSQGQAENGYRRALVLLQDGRLAEGIATLEQALFVYPRHEAARQTVAGLLLEQGRNDEASRHLQLGLGLNPNQPQMAMLLARLQLEHHGAAAVETLRRTLPHASANADYLGFLAAALQRQRRHREAIEQYDAALRLLPQNGVWWMGLGISLQAEGRKTEARAAFTRAKQAGLSPELQGFVERSLGQLN